ncbi:hypothetical protein LNO78_08025 [Klebsiella pneumoniae subsp. pneumoniae]|nr:hypothetical protein [Klebsiella pneumoniae subsp. pneumoniae]
MTSIHPGRRAAGVGSALDPVNRRGADGTGLSRLTLAETREAIEKKDGAGFIGTFTGASLYVLHTFATT